MRLKPLNVLIIGGTGEMGQWFSIFFKNNNFNVSVWGKSGRKDIAERLGVRFVDDLDTEIKKSDIVIISVPIDLTEQVISEIAPKMSAGSLLMDFTSIKVKPFDAMTKYAPEDVEIIGAHPMFGPSIASLYGQIIILTPPSDRSKEWFGLIKELFESNGAHIEIIDPREHDNMVSVVQGLTHFAYITIGTTFMELDFDIARSRRFMSPVYEIMVDFVGRILDQNPYLYAMIQMENPEVSKVHDTFLNQCSEISKTVKENNLDLFITKMKDAATHFGDTSSALRRSDKLINEKIAEFHRIVEAINTEKGFLHLYSNVTHVGTVEKVTPKEVFIKKHNKVTNLKIENIRLLSEDELLQWKIENQKHINRDISVLIPVNSNPSTIKNIISTVDGILKVDIIDIYDKVPEVKQLSVTYRICIFGDLEPEKIQDEVEQLLCGIGATIRV